MSIEQIIVLAIVQGISEFLPISSSGHLILVPELMGWSDQGLITDVMVHMGSFAAVVVYFRQDIWELIKGGLNLLRGNVTLYGKLALYIVVATIPAVIFGLYVKKTGLIDAVRGAQIVGWNAIIFGILMYVADRFSSTKKVMEDMKLSPAVMIGIAQAIAIIPGTSRSGITMTAARALGFSRQEAARFSFLLGIPAIAGAGVLILGDVIAKGETISTDALLTGGLTFFTALAAITFLMKLLKSVTFLPFVIYRLILGVVLLSLIYTGVIS